MTSRPPDAAHRAFRTPSRVDGTICDDVISGSIRQTAASILPENISGFTLVVSSGVKKYLTQGPNVLNILYGKMDNRSLDC